MPVKKSSRKTKKQPHHLHIVVDDALATAIDKKAKQAAQNVSTVARDLLRAALGMPQVVIR